MTESLAPDESARGVMLRAHRGESRTVVKVQVVWRGREVVRTDIRMGRVAVALGGIGWAAGSVLDWLVMYWPELRAVFDAVCAC